MQFIARAFILHFVFAAIAVAQQDRWIWDLSSLYSSPEAFDVDLPKLRRDVEALKRFRGRVAQGPVQLAEALEAISDARSRASQMAIYGFLTSAVDTESADAARRYDAATGIEIEVESAIEPLEEEIRSIGEERIRTWLAGEPALQRHRRRLLRIMAESAHSLPADAQAAVDSMARWPRLSGDAYDALMDSDLGWPMAKDGTGAEVPLSPRNVLRVARSLDAAGRAEVYRRFLGRLEELEDPFGLLYTRRIEADDVIARHRRFQNGMDAIWYLRDGMPPGSWRQMIDVGRKNIPVLRRYVDLRRRTLGYERMSYADLGVAPPQVAQPIPLERAVEMGVEALAPLGDAYRERLLKRIGERTMHLEGATNKNPMFAVFPAVGDARSYFILSYVPGIRGARTVTGGLALMMSFEDVPSSRRPDTRDDPGIYSNGVIYAGNFLFDDHVISKARDRQERIGLIVLALDLINRQYFRHVMTAELDQKVQEMVSAGRPPDGSEISAMHLGILRQYYGDIAGDEFRAEWMLESVPFVSYEHQFWPGAIAAAAVAVENRRWEFFDLLSRAEVDLTWPMMKSLGVDMATPEPYEAVIRRMNRLLDQLEKEVD